MRAPDFSTAGLTGRWKTLVEGFLASPQGEAVVAKVADAAKTANVYPPTPFRALELTPFERVRVVVLGQDPYHTPGKAEGLAFSVPEHEALPPSLKNIFKELEAEYGVRRTQGRLVDWAQAGVLLMNAILTVEEGKPLSHRRFGWTALTDGLIRALSDERDGLVFMLWGRPAQEKIPLIDAGKHLILTASHPSPLSVTRGPEPFLGCGHFKKADGHLGTAIPWTGAEPKEPSLFDGF